MEKAKGWSRTCGICKKQAPDDAEFTFSEEDLMVNKIGMPYVRCTHNHCINLSKNDPDEDLSAAINRKLVEPDVIKMIENAKKEREVVKMEKKREKEIKARLKEIEKRQEAGEEAVIDEGEDYVDEVDEVEDDETVGINKEEDYVDEVDADDELNVEDMLSNAGIGEVNNQIDRHPFMGEKDVEDEKYVPNPEEDVVNPEEYLEESVVNPEEYPEEYPEEFIEKWGGFPEKFVGKTWELFCPSCHEYFTFFIGDIKFKRNNIPFVSCLNRAGHFENSPYPVVITKDAMEGDQLLKEAVEYMRGLPENVEKIEDAKGNTKGAKEKTEKEGNVQEKPRRIEPKSKSKGKGKGSDDKDKGHIEVPKETDEVILKHGYMYEQGEGPVSVEMKEREKVKMWGPTALDSLKRERLENELNAVTGQKEVIDRVLKRFDNNEAVRNNQLALFDTIKEFITRLQAAYVTDIVNSVFSVDKRYRPLIDPSHNYGNEYGGNPNMPNMNPNMNMGVPPGSYNRQGGYGNEDWRGGVRRDEYPYSREPITQGDVAHIVKDAISEVEKEKERERYTTSEDVASIIKSAFEEFEDKKQMATYVTPEEVANIVKSAFTDRMTIEDKKRMDAEREREMWGLKNEITAVRSELRSGGGHPGVKEESPYLDFMKSRLVNLEKMRDEDLKNAINNMQDKKARSENFDLEMKKLDHQTELKKMELGEEEKKRDLIQGAIAPVAMQVGSALGEVIPNMVMPHPPPATEASPPMQTTLSVSSSPPPIMKEEEPIWNERHEKHERREEENKESREETEANNNKETEAKIGDEPDKKNVEQAFCPSCGNLIGFPKGVSAFRCPVCGTISEIRKCKECGAPIIYMRGASNVQCSSCGKVYRIKKVDGRKK